MRRGGSTLPKQNVSGRPNSPIACYTLPPGTTQKGVKPSLAYYDPTHARQANTCGFSQFNVRDFGTVTPFFQNAVSASNGEALSLT
jgi:hypothetical protein